MTTLRDQLQVEHVARTSHCRDAHVAWALEHEHLFTHALTLTFDITHVHRLLNKAGEAKMLHHPDVLALLHCEMKYFKWKLDKSLYGNQRGRIAFVPVLEGLGKGEKPHYHCMLGVSEDRFALIEFKVKAAWAATRLGGHHIDVKPYRDRGWIGYSTKNALFANRESIDWMNVLLPTRSPSTAE